MKQFFFVLALGLLSQTAFAEVILEIDDDSRLSSAARELIQNTVAERCQHIAAAWMFNEQVEEVEVDQGQVDYTYNLIIKIKVGDGISNDEYIYAAIHEPAISNPCCRGPFLTKFEMSAPVCSE